MAIDLTPLSVSLPEYFQLVHCGRQTGQLLVYRDQDLLQPAFSIWFSSGRIVAVSAGIEGTDLLAMLVERRWLSPRVAHQLYEFSGELAEPLGIYLSLRGILQPRQVSLLFHAQVLQRLYALFQLSNQHYQFIPQVQAPNLEMTGLSLSAAEAIMQGLRALKDWSVLAANLPAADVTLSREFLEKPYLALDSLERRVWTNAKQEVQLNTLSQQLYQPLEVIQQIAFRLNVVGLAETLPICLPVMTPAAKKTNSPSCSPASKP
jgi:hypothetical protein